MRDYSLDIIERDIKEILNVELSRTGILYRLHSRVKDPNSIYEKIERKGYAKNGKLIQDMVGFRITTYFNDDVRVIVDLCQALFGSLELIYDTPDNEVFKPMRKNMVCPLPKELKDIFNEAKVNNENLSYADCTFEIQFRTTLSEGWHEVDHNLRYKRESEWKELQIESRMLNGIYATLETSDQVLKSLFEDIAYHHYKKRNWDAMIRNKFRLRFKLEPLSQELTKVFNDDQLIAKTIFKLARNKIIEALIKSKISIPITLNNLVYFINYFFLHDPKIEMITPSILNEEFELSSSKLKTT